MPLDVNVLAAVQAIGADIKALFAAGGGGGSSLAARGVHAREPGLVAGRFISQQINAGGFSTIAGGANRLDLFPFIPARDITINELAVEVSTAIAGGLGRLCIYSSDGAGNPGAKLVEAATTFAGDAVGLKTLAIANTTLLAGTAYWLGVHSSSTQSYRGVAVASLQSLGHDATLNASYTSRRMVTSFAGGLPANASAATLISAIVPWFRLKIAA